jgi:hypothetical protein
LITSNGDGDELEFVTQTETKLWSLLLEQCGHYDFGAVCAWCRTVQTPKMMALCGWDLKAEASVCKSSSWIMEGRCPHQGLGVSVHRPVKKMMLEAALSLEGSHDV